MARILCSWCQRPVPVFRLLRDREFCCPEHRAEYRQQDQARSVALLLGHKPPCMPPAQPRREGDSVPIETFLAKQTVR